MTITADRTYKGFKLVSTGNGWNIFDAQDNRIGRTAPTLARAKETINQVIDVRELRDAILAQHVMGSRGKQA